MAFSAVDDVLISIVLCSPVASPPTAHLPSCRPFTGVLGVDASFAPASSLLLLDHVGHAQVQLEEKDAVIVELRRKLEEHEMQGGE